MYGMIHRGLRELVIEQAGAQAWAQVEKACGIGPSELISARVYEDSRTLEIVKASAQAMDMDLADCLWAFGRRWVRFAEAGSYGSIMDFAGQDLLGFLQNLDRMHAAVNLAMPEARTPTFAVVGHDQSHVRLRYWSEREGLQPLVVGLLEGLLQRFDMTGTIEQVEENAGHNGTDFIIAFGKP